MRKCKFNSKIKCGYMLEYCSKCEIFREQHQTTLTPLFFSCKNKRADGNDFGCNSGKQNNVAEKT